MALDGPENGSPTTDELVEALSVISGRLDVTRGSRSMRPAIALAAEIAFDRDLIRLCRAVGIPATHRHFDRPVDERARLLSRLSDLNGLSETLIPMAAAG